MRTFVLYLQDATRLERIPGVTSFVGSDATGSFGLLAGHARMMTSLIMGLARFRIGTEKWKYLALPGAALYFRNNELVLSTRHYLVDDDYLRISRSLRQQLLEEEKQLRATRESLHRLEDEIMRRLWQAGRGGRE